MALSLRVTPELRHRLVALADQTGRSIAQQSELMLTAGLELDSRLERIEEKLDRLLANTCEAPPGSTRKSGWGGSRLGFPTIPKKKSISRV